MLTAKDGEMDKINGLTLGASDIIQRNPRQKKKCDFPLGFGDGHKSVQVYGGRDANHFDTHRIFYSAHPLGEQRQRSQRRRIVSPHLAG